MNQTGHSIDIARLKAGTVIRAVDIPYSHVGLVSNRYLGNERMVISFSADADGFEEAPFSRFAKGHRVVVEGYLGRLPPILVLRRARLMKGRQYSWVSFNCEHFVRHCHGVKVESPQLQMWTILFGGVLFAALTARA